MKNLYQTCDMHPDSPEPFAYHHVLLGFTAYYVAERILKKACRRSLPALYERLKTQNQLVPFFGFCMGWLITLFSTPICFYAFLKDDQMLTSGPLEAPISGPGQICLASRSILWVSELNRLEFSPYYLKHHLASLGHLAIHLGARLPLAPIYLIYASLVTELLSTGLAILSMSGWKFGSRVQLARVASLVALRFPPIAYSVVRYYPRENGGRLTALVAGAALYGLSLVHLVWTMCAKYKIDFGSALVQRVGRSGVFYGFVVVAFLVSTVSTCYVYYGSGGTNETPDVLGLLALAALAGFVGAQVPGFLNGCKHKQYWFQAGAISAAATILFAPISAVESVERSRLLAAGGVSLLLGEAVGRVGCHFAGCCGSKFHATAAARRTRISVPLAVSMCCTVGYAAVLCLWIVGVVDLVGSSVLAVILQGIIRILAEGRRSDIPQVIGLIGCGYTATRMLAAFQVCLGTLVLLKMV